MIKNYHLWLVLLLVSAVGFGQSNTDFQGRFITGVEYKLNKKWKFEGQYRYALQNDWQQFRSSVFQAEARYNFKKYLSLSGGYRFTTSHESDNHRFFAAFNYKYATDNFTWTSSTKFQYDTDRFDREFRTQFKQPDKMTRQELGVDYNIPKSRFSVFSSAEIFLKTDSHPFFRFDRMRYSLGTAYNFKNYGKVDLSVFYENKYNPEKDDRIVLVTKYSYSLNDLFGTKKKKKDKDQENLRPIRSKALRTVRERSAKALRSLPTSQLNQ